MKKSVYYVMNQRLEICVQIVKNHMISLERNDLNDFIKIMNFSLPIALNLIKEGRANEAVD